MMDVIFEFIEGSHTVYALMLFLYSILCLMCSGNSLHVACTVYLAFRDVGFVWVKYDARLQ